jgi:HAD superfamily hydrolase (TIGR01549 family)
MPIDISKIQAVLFDIDGTLRDTDDMMIIRLARSLGWIKNLNSNFNPERLARRVIMAGEDPGNLLLSILDRLGFDDELARLIAFLEKLRLTKKPMSHLLIPGVIQILTTLKPAFRLGIVSARGERASMSFLDHHGLRPYFNCIVTAQSCSHTKPYPHPILHAANLLNVLPESCVMVGDTVVDIRAGKAANAQTIGVLSGFGEEQELITAGANLIIPSVASLSDIL